jgi:hypothetical protein
MGSVGGVCLFEREHHRRIASVLEALDAAVLEETGCAFGGGTAITLSHGEYRESVDIDLLISNVDGYRVLRERLSRRDGILAITRPGIALVQSREMRADQYGIRTLLEVRGAQIKLEIVLEARVTFETPTRPERICGIPRLTTLDLATTKLLANSDRWADDSVNSRDLIDLAMMRLDRETLTAAIEKARGAYGASIKSDLKKAIDALKRRRGRLDECMRALQMTPMPPGLASVPLAVLWKEIKRLAP